MAIVLELKPEVANRLEQEAKRLGLSTDEYAVNLIEEHLPVDTARQQAVSLLQSWIDADSIEEQTKTGAFLIQSLDEDRPSPRKLYPAALKGVSW